MELPFPDSAQRVSPGRLRRYRALAALNQELVELEARIQVLKEEAHQSGLLLRLEELALRLRKKADLQSRIRILVEELGDLMTEVSGAPPEREGPIRAAISLVEELIGRYRSLLGA